jgi:hypothetical protein
MESSTPKPVPVLPRERLLSFLDDNWSRNYGYKGKAVPIISVEPETISRPVTLHMNLCNLSSDKKEQAWFGGNMSYQKKLGFGEYSTYLRPNVCGNNMLSTFYMSRPPRGR